MNDNIAFEGNYDWKEKGTENYIVIQTSFLGLARQFERMTKRGYNFLAMTQDENIYTIVFYLAFPKFAETDDLDEESADIFPQPAPYPTVPINPQ